MTDVKLIARNGNSICHHCRNVVPASLAFCRVCLLPAQRSHRRIRSMKLEDREFYRSCLDDHGHVLASLSEEEQRRFWSLLTDAPFPTGREVVGDETRSPSLPSDDPPSEVNL